MTKYYQEALELYGIKQGFVDEQIDDILEKLKAMYDPERNSCSSSEYYEVFQKRHEVMMAYYMLKSGIRRYIVSANSEVLDKEILDEKILKFVYDSVASKRDIDEYFISDLVEMIVCARDLNDYVRQIVFEKYDKNSIASYADNNLKIYSSNVYDRIRNRTLSGFSDIEKDYNPYCVVVQFIGHELEHANHKKILDQNELNGIKEVILKADCYRHTKWDKEIERISKYPFVFYWLASKILEFSIFLDNRKYQKNWKYSPGERFAEFYGINLSLNLIQNLSTNYSILLPNLEKEFMRDLERVAFDFGYLGNPTFFYLQEFKQYEDSLQIYHMSKELSLEEKVIYGIGVSIEEQKLLELKKEKIIQKIRSL